MLLRGLASALRSTWLVAIAAAGASAASAQSEGGLYIAGAGFSFQVAAESALAQNPGGRRFFVLRCRPKPRRSRPRRRRSLARLRDRVVAANGVLLVCQRDIDNRKVDAARLTPGVVAVRGWPPQGSNELPDGQRYFANENPADLPAANEALRQLRSTCT